MEETVGTLRFGQRAKSIKLNVKVNQQRSVAELEMIVAQLQKDLSRLRYYSKRLEDELRSLRGADFDLEAFRKRIMSEFREESDSDASSTPATPTKASTGSALSAPGTPMSPHGAMSPLPVPPSPGLDYYLDPMAMAETKLAFEKTKQQLEFKIQDLQDEVSQLKEKASEGSRDVVLALEEQCQELKSEGEKMAYELNQKDLEIETIVAELSAAKERAEDLEKRSVKSAEQLVSLQAANETLAAEKVQLSSTIKSIQETAQSYKNQIVLLETSGSQFSKDKEGLQTTIREREDQVRGLQQQILDLKSQLDDASAMQQDTELQMRLLRQEKEVVEAALSSARGRLASGDSSTSSDKPDRIVVVSENVDKLRDENNILTKKLSTLEAEQEKLRGEVRGKDTQLQAERTKSKQATDTLRQASDQLREAQYALQSAQLDAGLKLDVSQNKFLNEQNSRLEAQKELERTKRTLEEKDRTIQTLNDNLSKLTREIKEERTKGTVQSRQVQESARRVQDLERELGALRSENRALREDLGLDPSDGYRSDSSSSSSAEPGNVDVVAEVRQWLGRVRRRSSLAVPVPSGGNNQPTPVASVSVPVGQQSARDFLANARSAAGNGAQPQQNGSTTPHGTSSSGNANASKTGAGSTASASSSFHSQSSSSSSLSSFSISGATPAATEPDLTGALTLLVDGKSWAVRFCQAKGSKLRIFQDRRAESPLLELNLPGLCVFRADNLTKKPNSFGLGLKPGPEAKFFVAANDESCDEWIQFLSKNSGVGYVS
jgi:predicted  nucleic acid-binding Zn-ribbon protein